MVSTNFKKEQFALLERLIILQSMGVKVWLTIATRERVVFDEVDDNAIFLLKHLDFGSISKYRYDESKDIAIIYLYI